MSPQGVLIADLLIGALGAFVIYLLVRGKIYAGYAVLWLLALLAAMALVTFEPLQLFFTHALGAVYPASALTMAALAFIILLLIYFTVQVTVLGDRVTQLAQHIALQQLEREQQSTTSSPSSAPDA